MRRSRLALVGAAAQLGCGKARGGLAGEVGAREEGESGEVEEDKAGEPGARGKKLGGRT